MNAPLQATEIARLTAITGGEDLCELSESGVSYTLVLPSAGEDYIQKRIASDRQPYEIEMLRDMRSRLRPGDLVLDIGANVGNHAIYLATVAQCRVIAFEPNSGLCSAMLRSIELNGLHQRVQVRAVAVGKDEARGAFDALRPTNLGAQRVVVGSGTLPVVRLDDLSLDGPVHALKIDVEGMESAVLEGARNILERDHPLLYVECQTEEDFRRIADQLMHLGYGYLETFNATPTHLFVSEARIGSDKRLVLMQRKAIQETYRRSQVIETLRSKLSTLQDRLTESFERQGVLKERHAVEHAAKVAETERKVRAEADLAEARSRIQALENAIRDSSQQQAEQGLLLEKANRYASQQEAQVQSLSARLEVSEARLQAVASERGEDVKRWEAVAGAKDAVVAQLAGERNSWRHRFDALQIDNGRLQGELQCLKSSAIALNERQREQITNGERQLAELQDRLERLKQQLEQISAHRDRLQAELSLEQNSRLALLATQEELQSGLRQALTALEESQTSCAGARSEQLAAQARLERARADYQDVKALAARRGQEADQLRSRLSRADQERIEALQRASEMQAKVASLIQEQRATQTMMREVFQVHDALAAREGRSRIAAAHAQLKLERTRGHLSYRLGHAVVAHARPGQWVRMPLAMINAWRSFRDARGSEPAAPRTMHSALLLVADHPSGHLSLSTAWQSVEAVGGAGPQTVWLRALSLSTTAAIDIEWNPDNDQHQLDPSHLSLLAGQHVALTHVPSGKRVRGGMRKVSGPPCILELVLRASDSPVAVLGKVSGKGREPVVERTSPDSPTCAPLLPSVDSIAYRTVPYMERRKGGQRAAQVVFNEGPLISVIMTTFNTAALVEAAIDSILAQTWQNLELIVVDDCSSDETRDRVALIAKRDHRVRLLCFGDNRGTYWCKNYGITVARGEVLTFMDSDDLSAPTRLAEQFAELNQPGRVMVTCNLVRQDESGQVLAINGQTERIAPISKMIKRDVIREIGYFDTIRTSADDEFMQRVKLVYGRQAHTNIPKVLYTALVRQDSLTSDPENAINLAAATNGAAYLSAPRKHYADSYSGWHRSLIARGMVPYMPFPVVDRPFPVYGKLRVKDGRYDGNTISVCLASFPPRREQLRRTVLSAIDHVDAVYVYLNGYESVPDFLDHPRIHVTLGRDARGDLRDNGKFYLAERVPEGYCFTIDDDIDYPTDYFESLIRKIEFYDRQAVVGLHGTVFAKPFRSYFKGRTLHHFRDRLEQDRLVNQLGTGTVAFHTSLVRPSLDWFIQTGMADAYFAVEMKRRNIGLVAVSRDRAWLSPQPIADDPDSGNTNLYEEFKDSDALQTELMQAHAPFHELPRGTLAQLLEQRRTSLGAAWSGSALATAPEVRRESARQQPTSAPV